MRVRTGTSGFAFKEWKGPFYPPDLPDSQMLRHYAGRLGTVEINNTFYRMPTPKLLAGWAEQVPDPFSFALKAPRRISHQKKLAACGEEVGALYAAADALGARRGPVLFQLPPFFKKDLGRLAELAAVLPPDARAALEFRNASWFDDEVYDLLRQHGLALVVSDNDGADEPPLVPTARLGYLRLRREGYDEAQLGRWAARVAAQPWDAAWVFFKHEDAGAGPRLAARFQTLIDAAAR